MKSPKSEKNDYLDISGGIDFERVQEKTELYKTPRVPRPEELRIALRNTHSIDNEFVATIDNRKLVGIVPAGQHAPGTAAAVQARVAHLEKLVAASKDNIESLQQGRQRDREKLDLLSREQRNAADEWRLAAGELLLNTAAHAQHLRETNRELLKQPAQIARTQAYVAISATNSKLLRAIDHIAPYVDLSKTSEYFGAMVFSKTMQEHFKNREFADAATEGTLFLADAAIEATNNILSDPAMRDDAVRWITGAGGNIVRGYSFTRDAINSIAAAHQFAEHTLNAHEVLENIDNAAELQKVLSQQHKKHVDKLQEAKRELNKIQQK
jgi:hypothetical protein